MSKELEAFKEIRNSNTLVYTPLGYEEIDIKDYYAEEFNIVEQALEEHEAVEQEFGINLKILLKAFKKVDDYDNKNEVVYMKSRNGEIFAVKGISLHYCPCNFFIAPNYDREGKSQFMTYWIKDYGKTWALTIEELVE